MSKVKSKSQKIGEAGEGLVRFWAPINMHSANKIENDFGNRVRSLILIF